MGDMTVALLSEQEVFKHINDIARLRIDIFREYPYLYDGNVEYETRYLRKFSDTPHSVIVVFKEGDDIVGAITGLPLSCESESVKAPWLSLKRDISRVYYFSENLLYPQYRGKLCGHPPFET
jgi:hypothetical protein